ncbi:2-oxoacid:acceptor oxidoreductase subunit alpha [Candidatus Woesebacteria bacterium]|nr:2-oxoacid:acceptor oxidoreductase subunit alpha [Candidatus Woesebacteria bacterium]
MLQDQQTLPFDRYTIKVVGESGQGVNSVGEIIARSLKQSCFFTFGYREYPSLIKGGYASHQTDVSGSPLSAPSRECNILLCLSRVSVHKYLQSLRRGGVLLHSITRMDITAAEQEVIAERQLTVLYVPAVEEALKVGGSKVMANMVLIGVLWQLLRMPTDLVEKIMEREFVKKPDVIPPNKACLQAGYTWQLPAQLQPIQLTQFCMIEDSRGDDLLLTGNHALALGAVSAGVRAYFAYPMTPSSSILTFLADWYHETGMLVKQVEDEISVAQMAIGAMFAGTRALVGTSGGGFDLMTESLSLAAMTETPFVCILAQRPGPATGLPTWTSATDLNLAVYSGHGEFTRLVIAASDATDCYTLIQHAFNYSEEFQIPVIVMTDKEIAESMFQVDHLPPAVPIERHLVAEGQRTQLEPEDRFRITETGVSVRWLPGETDATYNGNSDEHLEDGSLTEEADASKAMYDKRLRKQETLLERLPEPELFGPNHASLLFVGWGSVKNTILDVLEQWNTQHHDHLISYLHYTYVFPLKPDFFLETIQQADHVVLVEQNALGQLGGLITQHTGYLFTEKLLKYDGRPFFVEDVWEYLQQRFGHVDQSQVHQVKEAA